MCINSNNWLILEMCCWLCRLYFKDVLSCYIQQDCIRDSNIVQQVQNHIILSFQGLYIPIISLYLWKYLRLIYFVLLFLVLVIYNSISIRIQGLLQIFCHSRWCMKPKSVGGIFIKRPHKDHHTQHGGMNQRKRRKAQLKGHSTYFTCQSQLPVMWSTTWPVRTAS